MDLNTYQTQAVLHALPICKSELFYNVLGLCGESGEVAEKIKKIYRDHDGLVTETDRNSIVKELGDVLWYLANIARFLNVDLEEVAQINIEKCAARRETNTLHGEGDDREEFKETRTQVYHFGEFSIGDYVQVVGNFMSHGKRGNIIRMLETTDNIFFQIADTTTGDVFEVWNPDSIIKVDSIVQTGTTYPKDEGNRTCGGFAIDKEIKPLDPTNEIQKALEKQRFMDQKIKEALDPKETKKEEEPLLFDLVYIEEQSEKSKGLFKAPDFIGRKGVLTGWIDDLPKNDGSPVSRTYYVQPRCESAIVTCKQVKKVPALALEEEKNQPGVPHLGDAVIISTFSYTSKYNGAVGTLVDMHDFDYMEANEKEVLETPEWALPYDVTIRPDAYKVRMIDGTEKYFPIVHKLEQYEPENVKVDGKFTRGDKVTVHLPVNNQHDGEDAIVISKAKVNGKGDDGYIVRDIQGSHCFWAKTIS